MWHKKFIIISFIILSIGVGYVFFAHRSDTESSQQSTQVATKSSSTTNDQGQQKSQQTKSQEPSFDKTKYSTVTPSSLWVVVNKQRSLPASYIPANLRVPKISLRTGGDEMKMRSDAATALETMTAVAKKSGINLMVASGYRSYALQKIVYANEVKNYGQKTADTESARPGHSEHQTGLAVDLAAVGQGCLVMQCFGNTPAGKWIAANSYKYGFIIRYQQGTQKIVGYEYEPWHVRYLGTELAKEVHDSGLTLEQFFGLPAAPDYN